MSLVTSGDLTLPLVASAAASWSFVPLLEIAALAVAWSFGNRALSLSRTIDLFFTGNTPWLFWLVGFGALWSRFPQPYWSFKPKVLCLGSAVLAFAWSAYIDFCFHRSALGNSSNRSIRLLVLQRALAWGPGILLFGYGSLWADLVGIFR